MKICAFTGSRPEKMPVLQNPESAEYKELIGRIRTQIKELTERENVTSYLSGAAKGIDLIAAEIVLELKRDYPKITLECVVPYLAQANGWSEEHKEQYQSVLDRSDKVTVLQEDFSRGCLQKRNRYLVENADIVLAVWNGTKGGTEYTIKYAEKLNKELIIIHVDQDGNGGCCAKT